MNRTHTHTFHVSGMHYKACVLLVDNELKDIDGVESVTSGLDTRTVVVNGNFGEKSAEAIAEGFPGLTNTDIRSIEAEVMNSKLLILQLQFLSPRIYCWISRAPKVGLINLITSKRNLRYHL